MFPNSMPSPSPHSFFDPESTIGALRAQANQQLPGAHSVSAPAPQPFPTEDRGKGIAPAAPESRAPVEPGQNAPSDGSPKGHVPAADTRKPEPQEDASAQQPDKPSPPQGLEQNRTTEASPGSQARPSGNWFLQPGERPHVYFPPRPGNSISVLPSGAEVFKRLWEDMEKARHSIDIITWGLDTDMRFTRVGNPNEYYRTLYYDANRNPQDPHKGFYPAQQNRHPPADNWNERGLPAANGADGDENSTVFADVLTRLATKKNIKIRLLVWEPAYMAKNLVDPLHFWWRCKTGIIPNIEFAFRSFNGKQPEKTDRPQLWEKNKDGTESSYRGGAQEKIEQRVDKATSNKNIYNLLYTHHQKEVIIDVEHQELAVGYIIGCNTKEEYWDTVDHKTWDKFRRPYQPWRDAGVRLRGPVLHDMAVNFRESWRQTLREGQTFLEGGMGAAWDRLKQRVTGYTREVFPTSLIGAALAAGIKPANVYNKAVLERFNLKAYSRFAGLNPDLEISPAEAWDYKLAPQCAELCAFLTSLLELMYGLTSGGFETDGMLRPAASWDVSIPDPYKFKNDAPGGHTVQFLRTFTLEDAPKDLSIREAYSRALQSLQHNDLIYIENQYFRDPFFAGEIQKVCEAKKIKPNIIVVTNMITNEKGTDIGEMSQFSKEPTYIAYRMLEKAGINIQFCWLRVLSAQYPIYKEPRGASIANILLDTLLKSFAQGRNIDLMAVRIMQAREYLLQKLYPYLCTADTLGGLSTLQRLDVDPRVRFAVQAFLGIKENMEELRKQFQELIDFKNALMRGLHDMIVEYTYKNIDAILPTIDVLIEKILSVADKAEKEMYPEMRQKKIDLLLERWKNNLNIFHKDKVIAPYVEMDPEIRHIESMMKGYRNFKKSIPPPKAKDMRGNIYIHSKVMIINDALAIVGSANLNERSMWHDSETAVAFAANERASPPRELRDKLMAVALNGKLSREEDGGKIFEDFDEKVKFNDRLYGSLSNTHHPLLRLPYRALPLTLYPGMGSFTIS